jgi:anti-sigma factor RsiW
MSCHDYQKEMLVFDLLDNSEQAKLEAHISTCTTCQAEWAKFKKLNSTLGQARQHAPAPKHHAQLTDQIMTVVIEVERSKNSQSNSKTWFSGNFFRIGLAGLSVCLMIGFIAEFSTPVMPVAGTESINPNKTLLQGDWLKTKLPTRAQLVSSTKPCIAKNTTDLACLKSNLHRVIRNIDNKN